MLVEDNRIILNLDKGTKILELNELKNVKIFYAGDIFWKSFTSFFTKLKGNNRYYSKHWSTKQLELNGIDKIFLNEEEYHVFIKRQDDKNQLLDFMSLLRKNNINVSWQEGNFKPPQILKF